MLVAMMADMRIAAEDSQFGIPAAKLGVAYSVDGLRHLVSLVGPSQARLMMFSGMRLSSTEASRIGLADRIIPTDQLWPFTLDLARTIADNAPLSIAVSKIGIAELMRDPADRDMDRVAKASEICMNSDDFKEGRQAFAEKRRPKFRGR